MATATSLIPYYDLAKQGTIFTGNVAAAGVILPIYSNTTQQVGLWNPVGSGKDIILLKIDLTYVDTTGAAGGYCLGYLSNAPAAIGTGLSITAFTETASVSNYPGGGFSSIAKFGQGATLTVTAPVVKRQLGLNQNAFTAAGTGQMAFRNEIEFSGEEVLTPGTAIFVAGNIATIAKYTGSLVWAEVTR